MSVTCAKIAAVDRRRVQWRHIEMPPEAITVQRDGPCSVLCLSGEIDAFVIEEFTRTHGDRPLVADVIDASAVTFMSVGGISLLLRCRSATPAGGRAPVLRPASEPVERLLRLAGVESLFQPTEPTEPTGSPSLRSGGGS